MWLKALLKQNFTHCTRHIH